MADARLTRSARLIVCDPDGVALGSTPFFTVPSPHWGFVEPLEATAKSDLGLSITVLRLLSVEQGTDGSPDRTSYLVQAAGPIVGLYRHFLDHIEPDERIYHATDDLLWLRRTAEQLESP